MKTRNVRAAANPPSPAEPPAPAALPTLAQQILPLDLEVNVAQRLTDLRAWADAWLVVSSFGLYLPLTFTHS